MTRLPLTLTRAMYLVALGVIGAAAAIGLADSPDRAGLGWLLLALVCVVAFKGTRFRFVLLTAAGVALLFVAIVAVRAGSKADSRALLASLIVTGVALLLTPCVLAPFLARMRGSLQRLGEQEQEIDELRVRDQATGVYRSRHVERLLDEEVERARRYNRALTLCIIAIDGWHDLVNQRGEAAMRRTLAKIEQSLSTRQRMLDKIIALGDGELALLLPETPLEGAEVVAGRIQSQIAGEAGVSLRIGLSDFPEGGSTREELIQEARQALEFGSMANLPIVDRTFLAVG